MTPSAPAPVKQYVRDEDGNVHEILVAAVVRPKKGGGVRIRPPKAGDPVKAGYKPSATPPETPASAEA